MQTVSDKSLAQCCIQQIVLIILYRCISVRFIHFYSIIQHHGYSCECEWFAKMQIDAMLAFRPRLGQYKQAKHRTHCVFAWRRDHSVCGLKRRDHPIGWYNCNSVLKRYIVSAESQQTHAYTHTPMSMAVVVCRLPCLRLCPCVDERARVYRAIAQHNRTAIA